MVTWHHQRWLVPPQVSWSPPRLAVSVRDMGQRKLCSSRSVENPLSSIYLKCPKSKRRPEERFCRLMRNRYLSLLAMCGPLRMHLVYSICGVGSLENPLGSDKKLQDIVPGSMKRHYLIQLQGSSRLFSASIGAKYFVTHTYLMQYEPSKSHQNAPIPSPYTRWYTSIPVSPYPLYCGYGGRICPYLTWSRACPYWRGR